ncbi:MAG: methyl-accepting chemotaxis protein [Gammaproteobacteria bacterium]|nr:methyl-accepting chemotaxis protein [Gammaproteobacteria bacterium]
MSLSFTVIQRIAGGFALMVLLLIALGLSGLSSKNSLSGSLDEVSTATTSRGLSYRLQVALLEVGHYADAFHLSQELGSETEMRAGFDKAHKKLDELAGQLKQASAGYEEFAQPLKAFEDSAATVVATAEELFKTHHADLEFAAGAKRQKPQLENTGDELDTLLADALDAGAEGEAKDALETLRQNVKESLITASDALRFDSTDSIRVAVKDVNALADSLSQAGDKVAKSSLANAGEIGAAVAKFKDLLNGAQAPLPLYLQSYEMYDKGLATGKTLEGQIDAARTKADKLVELTNKRADTAKSDAGTASATATALILIISLSAIAMAAVVAWWVIGSIRKPLARIGHVLQQIAGGDFTQRAEIKTADEFGELGRNVDELTHRLRGMLRNIAGSSVQLAAAAEETAAITSQTSTSIAQQKLQTDAIATAMAEMAATVDEVARSAENTLREVKGAQDVAQNGQAVVNANIETINNLSGEIEDASKVITQLDEYSNSIGKVLDVIRSVADQTNLLALNAAIEAARAGEHGRGFAVVADEVRTLASRTQESTREINTMIDNLQSGVRNAVMVMELSRKETANGVEQAGEAGRALEAITRMVGVINDMSTHIASAAEEQSATTQDMHQNIVSISEIAEQTSEGANQTNQACEDLAKLAEQLQHLVAQFKV